MKCPHEKGLHIKKETDTTKKIVSLILALLMVLSCMSFAAAESIGSVYYLCSSCW